MTDKDDRYTHVKRRTAIYAVLEIVAENAIREIASAEIVVPDPAFSVVNRGRNLALSFWHSMIWHTEGPRYRSGEVALL
jgi:hypothetical protein